MAEVAAVHSVDAHDLGFHGKQGDGNRIYITSLERVAPGARHGADRNVGVSGVRGAPSATEPTPRQCLRLGQER